MKAEKGYFLFILLFGCISIIEKTNKLESNGTLKNINELFSLPYRNYFPKKSYIFLITQTSYFRLCLVVYYKLMNHD